MNVLREKLHAFLAKKRKFIFQNLFRQDVLIVANKGNRDTLGLFLVYSYLKNAYGLRVKIRPAMLLHDFWIKFYRPKVAVEIAIDSPGVISYYQLLGNQGSTRLMMMTEVFATPQPDDYVAKYPYQDIIEGALLPGDHIKEILIQHQKISENQALVVGYPLLDWGHEPFRKWFLGKKEFCRKKNIQNNKKMILLATSFSLADIDLMDWDSRYSHWPVSISKERTRKNIAISKKMRERCIDYFTRLLAQHPDWHLLIRKHPFENPNAYNQAWRNHSQVTEVHTEEIHDLLSACDVLVHWNSTVSVQAWGFGKPTIILDSEEDFFQDQESANSQKGNYYAITYGELETALKAALGGQAVPREQLLAREQFMEKWFYKQDGLASSRAAKYINEFFQNNRNRQIGYQLSIFDILRALKVFFRYRLKFFWVRWFARNQVEQRLLPHYDNFALEFHHLRFEKQLKNYLTRQPLK